MATSCNRYSRSPAAGKNGTKRRLQLPQEPEGVIFSRHQTIPRRLCKSGTMTDSTAEFDAFAADYDLALEQGLSLTGESKDFFAEARLRWLRSRLVKFQAASTMILDFGCGTGSSVPWFLDLLEAERIIGSDVSPQSLEVARERWQDYETEFVQCGDEEADSFDLAFCNGVFHHIVPEQRDEAFQRVFRALKPGGVFAFWENNPANPGTRLLMKRIPFDRDAILVWPNEARRRLRATGFEVLLTDFVFYFPEMLRALRPLEPWLSKLPLGGQYLILARKP